MNISAEKSSFRQRLKAQRDALSAAEVRDKSRRILDHLMPMVNPQQHIFCYISHRNEVDTHTFIQACLAKGVRLSAPRVIGDGVMEARRIDEWDAMTIGRFGVLEPEPDAKFAKRVELCVAPCVAVTERGDRLGMGGGYYDRWFAAHPKVKRVALAYEAQVVEALPTDERDQKVDLVVTESRVIDCRSG